MIYPETISVTSSFPSVGVLRVVIEASYIRGVQIRIHDILRKSLPDTIKEIQVQVIRI